MLENYFALRLNQNHQVAEYHNRMLRANSDTRLCTDLDDSNLRSKLGSDGKDFLDLLRKQDYGCHIRCQRNAMEILSLFRIAG